MGALLSLFAGANRRAILDGWVKPFSREPDLMDLAIPLAARSTTRSQLGEMTESFATKKSRGSFCESQMSANICCKGIQGLRKSAGCGMLCGVPRAVNDGCFPNLGIGVSAKAGPRR